MLAGNKNAPKLNVTAPIGVGKLVNCRLRLVAGKCALRRLRRYHYESIAPPTLFLHNVGGALFPLGHLVRKEDDF